MLYSGFNTLHRSVFWSADFNGRSDNTDVIRLRLAMPKRLTILGLLIVTACIALAIAVALRSIRPVYEIQFYNDTSSEITDLNLFVYPLLTTGAGLWDELAQQSVSPGQCVTFRHNIENANLDFNYHVDGRKIEYTNLELSGRRKTELRTTPSGEWAGDGDR